MYHAFDATQVRSLIDIGPEDALHGLIVHGVYDMPDMVRRWRDRLANARVAGDAFNIVIGEHSGHTIWYAPVLGAPLAAFVTHCAAVLGVGSIVQIGSYGGTRAGISVGDLLLVTGAGRGEAASDWYLPQGRPATPDEGLCDQLRASLACCGLAWHEGSVFTTSAFMAEKWEDIQRWEREGYAGVEMEAATTLAIAESFRVPAACLLYLLDNLIEERHLLATSNDERARIRQSLQVVEDVALELVSR